MHMCAQPLTPVRHLLYQRTPLSGCTTAILCTSWTCVGNQSSHVIAGGRVASQEALLVQARYERAIHHPHTLHQLCRSTIVPALKLRQPPNSVRVHPGHLAQHLVNCAHPATSALALCSSKAAAASGCASPMCCPNGPAVQVDWQVRNSGRGLRPGRALREGHPGSAAGSGCSRG